MVAGQAALASPAAAFYVFVLDQNGSDPDSWVCNGSSADFDVLFGQVCFHEPSRSLPRAIFIAVSSARITPPIPSCVNPESIPESGVVYGLRHV